MYFTSVSSETFFLLCSKSAVNSSGYSLSSSMATRLMYVGRMFPKSLSPCGAGARFDTQGVYQRYEGVHASDNSEGRKSARLSFQAPNVSRPAARGTDSYPARALKATLKYGIPLRV